MIICKLKMSSCLFKGQIVGKTEGDLKDRHWFRYLGLVEQLLQDLVELYPGWRMRIYHNITEDDEVFPHMCDLYCNHPHVDTCDMRQHPTEGDLQDRFPAGMMWRFLVLNETMKRDYLLRFSYF